MAILGILWGIILVLAGISFMATPLATYLATGYIFAIMLLVGDVPGRAGEAFGRHKELAE